MRGPEAKIQDAVVKYARSKGLLCKKNEVGKFFTASGWPDFMVIGAGKAIFLEFKRPGGKLTPLQEEVARKIKGQGFRYFVIDGASYGKAVIDGEFG